MKAGVQVSSFKPMLRTADEVRAAFERIRAMGCDTVQLQWIDPSVPTAVIAQALRAHALQSVSVQDFYVTIRENPAYYIDLNARTGGTWMCVSRIPPEYKRPEAIPALAEALRAFAKALEGVGQKLCFHPVSADFAPVDGVNLAEALFAQMPELAICADLYHLWRSGYDLPAWIARNASRICMVHFKDATYAPDGTEQLVPAGQGTVNWAGAVRACVEAGVPYAFAEQERWDRDPFVCIEEAVRWIEREIAAC